MMRMVACLCQCVYWFLIKKRLENFSTLQLQIGIDVEEKQRKLKNNVITFARRYFSPDEVKNLSAISDPEVQRQELVNYGPSRLPLC